ncbi:hypothetical protein [Actinoalloteichus caeruleus]|uniref:hypothetical protein n=1 Tax=Actinoalloteichus cyanogriseus TaxID=2893586 RepID=UPI003AAEE76B
MTEDALSSAPVILGFLALAALVLLCRTGRRRSRPSGEPARTRVASLGGRVLLTASVIVVTQWAVMVYASNAWLRLGVLALPAVFAAYTVTKAVVVTAIEPPRDGRR